MRLSGLGFGLGVSGVVNSCSLKRIPHYTWAWSSTKHGRDVCYPPEPS